MSIPTDNAKTPYTPLRTYAGMAETEQQMPRSANVEAPSGPTPSTDMDTPYTPSTRVRARIAERVNCVLSRTDIGSLPESTPISFAASASPSPQTGDPQTGDPQTDGAPRRKRDRPKCLFSSIPRIPSEAKPSGDTPSIETSKKESPTQALFAKVPTKEISAQPPRKELEMTAPSNDLSAELLKERIQNTFHHSESQLVPLSRGKNGALELLDQNGCPVAVFKIAQRELGTKESLATNPDAVCINEGIPVGEGAFLNFLGAIIARAYIGLSRISTDVIYIPAALYMTEIQHADLGNTTQARDGAVIEFVPDCHALSKITKDKLAELNVEGVQLMALIFCLLLQVDGNAGNTLIQNTDKGHRIIPIDFTILPKPIGPGINLGLYDEPWMHLPQLNRPTQQTIKTFINHPKTGHIVLETLENLRQNNQHARDFDPIRSRMHQIAFQLCKTGINKDLSLRDISQCFLHEEFTPNIVAWMHNHLSHKEGLANPNELSHLCDAFIEKYIESLKTCRTQKPLFDPNSNEQIPTYYDQALRMAKKEVEKSCCVNP